MTLLKISDELYVMNYQDRKALLLDGVEEVFEALGRWGIPFTEIEMAVTDMVKNDTNRACFGNIKKSFMFTDRV